MADKILAQELPRGDLMDLLVYCAVTGIFRWRVSTSNRIKVGDVAGCIDSTTGYQRIRINGNDYQAHRLAWLYVHGVWPSDQIDHVNRDRTDNRIANLREATSAENMRNISKRHDNTSGHVGVRWDKASQKWKAYIKHESRLIHLGYYDLKEDAIAARRAGEIRYWGAVRSE